MAGYELIDAYLASLRTRMAWHRDGAAVDSELRDHLYSAAEALERQGADPDDAQRRVLDRFGDPTLVATAFATTGSRGVAVPTAATNSAGAAALIGAVAWVAVGAGMSASHGLEEATGTWEGAPRISFIAATASLVAAAGLTLVTLVGLQRRHGGLGVIGHAGVAVTTLGAAASFVSWFIYGWSALIGVGTLLISAAMLRRGIAPRTPTLLVGGAWPIAIAVGAVLVRLQVGTRDEWGDYPLARTIMVALGATLFAAGLAGIGRWLTREQPQPTLTAATG